MKKYNSVGWFEIPVTDLERSKKFYETMFEVKLEHMEMPGMVMEAFPMDDEAIGSSGALAQGEHYKPTDNGTIVYFTAKPNVEEALKKVEAAGGEILLDKTSIGEHGYIAWLKDTEGNRIAIHSMEG